MDNPYNKRHPMCQEQPAQIDCRVTNCKYYGGKGECLNVSPAMVLNPDETYVCWSKEEINPPPPTKE